MTEAQRQLRNLTMLSQCNSTFRTQAAGMIIEMQEQSFAPRIQCAWRSVEDQEDEYKAGHSHVLYGFHNATDAAGKPDALAIDLLDDDHPLNPSRTYVVALARMARKYGLVTGIDWDLPMNIKMALGQAIRNNQMWTGKIGFDPCHVEVRGLTIAEAQSGKRPGLTA